MYSLQSTMNISKNSRLPTFYEETSVNDAMVLRSGKRINLASSTPFGDDTRAIVDLFLRSPCLKQECSYGMYSHQYGITIYGGKKQIVEYHQELMRKKGLSQWGTSFYGRNKLKAPKYMLEIMKQEFCGSCLRSDLILSFVSKYKMVYRFTKSEKLREMALSKLDEVIDHCSKNKDYGYTCSSCEFRQEEMRMKIYQGPITRSGTRSGRNIELAVLASMTKRNNFETLEKAKYLKKYINSPHVEVQTAYFKLGSVLPGDCVKAVFSFL